MPRRIRRSFVIDSIFSGSKNMSQEDNKEFEMAVGTSNIMESNIMDESENFYTPMESATEPEPASESSWNIMKSDRGQLCRSCAKTSDYFIPIYEGEGLEHQLEYKIQKHLPIQVSSVDTLPLQLCYQCASTLIAWDSMINSCIEADKKLRAMQEAAEEIKQNQVFEDSQTEADAETNADADLVDSDDEPLISSKTKLLSENNIGNKEATPLKKKILSKAKSKTVTAKNEKTAQDSKEEEDKERSRPPQGIDLTSVRIDNKGSASHGVHETSYHCQICDSSLECDKTQFAKHVRDHLTRLSKSEANNSKVGKAVRKLRSEGRKIRTGEIAVKYFTCHLCGKQFSQATGLSYHLKHVHEGIKEHGCDICGRKFALKSAVEDHRRIHTGERPFVCHTCGKSFKAKASLYIHSKTHTDLFPHSCTYCQKRFRWRQQLLSHITTHTGEKKHFCETCGKGFGVKNDLTRHKLVHSEEKPFLCLECGLSFGQKRYLKNHEKSRHKNNIVV